MDLDEETLYIALCVAIIDDMTRGGLYLRRRDVWPKVEQEMSLKGFRGKLSNSRRSYLCSLFEQKKTQGERFIGPKRP